MITLAYQIHSVLSLSFLVALAIAIFMIANLLTNTDQEGKKWRVALFYIEVI